MVNSSRVSSPASAQDERQLADCPPDNKLPENSQENLNARLDHGIEETFPTSDPVSVHITAGPAPDRSNQEARSSSADDQPEGQEQDPTERLLDQVRGALQDVADSASGAAQDAFDKGNRYVRQARERYPEAERYAREGQRVISQQVAGNPLLALFMAGVAGYALGWLIHGRWQGRDNRVPDYGRTQRSHTPYRDKHWQ